MKRFLIVLIVVSMLGFNTIAFASEVDQTTDVQTDQTVEAGITPDSILYSADQLFEDLQLLLTTDPEKDAELLLKFAQERLAEAKEMTEEQKTEYVKAAMEDYIATLNQAEEKVTEVAADEGTTEEVKEELSQQLEDTATVDESIEGSLDTEQQEQLEEETTEAGYTASVVKDLDPEVVKTLREAGMGFGNIAHTVALAELSGKSVDEIAAMIDEGKGIGNIAKELGIHPSKMNKSAEVADKEDTTTDEADGEETADENTGVEGTAADLGNSTAAGAETQQTVTTQQATATQQAASAKTSKSPMKKVQAAVKKTQTTSEKAEDKQATTSIQQETNIVTSSTSEQYNKNEVKSNKNNNENEVKNTKTASENGNSEKSSKGNKK